MKKASRPIVIGNWKMNPQSEKMASRLAAEIKKGLSKVAGVDVVLTAPFLYIQSVEKIRSGSKKFSVGAQDAHWEKLGAQTGEISAAMLKSFGVTHILVGHSERRALGETDEQVNKKVLSILKEEITPVVCIGEKKRDQQGNYLSLIEGQIRKACAGVSRPRLEKVVIAYEPIWAIGTGDTATPEDVHEMKIYIQKVLADIYGRNHVAKVRIIYGGSVSAKNAGSLMEGGMVDGFLPGGASLRPEEFIQIVKAAK